MANFKLLCSILFLVAGCSASIRPLKSKTLEDPTTKTEVSLPVEDAIQIEAVPIVERIEQVVLPDGTKETVEIIPLTDINQLTSVLEQKVEEQHEREEVQEVVADVLNNKDASGSVREGKSYSIPRSYNRQYPIRYYPSAQPPRRSYYSSRPYYNNYQYSSYPSYPSSNYYYSNGYRGDRYNNYNNYGRPTFSLSLGRRY